MHGQRVVLHCSPTVDDVWNVYAPINCKPQGTPPPPPPPTTTTIEVGYKWMWSLLATPNKMAPAVVDLCAGFTVLLPRQLLSILPCHVTICIQKDAHRPGWICRYFRESRRAGKFKPGISRPGGKYRKLTTAAAVTAAVIWAIRGAWENNFPTFTVGVYRRDPGLGLRPRPGPCGTPRQWM